MTAKFSAQRVKELLQSGAVWSLPLSASSPKGEGDPAHALECSYFKLPKIPPSLEILFPKLAKKIQERQKKRCITLWKQQEKEVPQERFSTFVSLDNVPLLSRIQRWRAGDYLNFARHIQKHGKQKDPVHTHHITWLHEMGTESSSKDSQDALWEEMIKGKEERQYRIGDVTNYFS